MSHSLLLMGAAYTLQTGQVWFNETIKTFRADTVRELAVTACRNIRIELRPIVSFIMDFFAVTANRQKTRVLS